jgi:hypothetical protein
LLSAFKVLPVEDGGVPTIDPGDLHQTPTTVIDVEVIRPQFKTEASVEFNPLSERGQKSALERVQELRAESTSRCWWHSFIIRQAPVAQDD